MEKQEKELCPQPLEGMELSEIHGRLLIYRTVSEQISNF